MGIEQQIAAAEKRLQAALIAGEATQSHRDELARLRADLANQRSSETQAAAAVERASRQAAEASIQLDAERIAAEAAGRLQTFLAAFTIEDQQ
ncbi:hypothetical protein [Cupriavidus pinatubonensis]|uniref:Uncharacterized protein n=1 Tax=Cupriavidus pinatubonensis TaxID=248026 RepID=A0ABM8WL57_9BURK|nr:hypothetical protein [Cupriavidus pinatubonensis]CAG9168131.1 hypothetical protein LMG23994_01316 [Cupriavidus pinatubonensis]